MASSNVETDEAEVESFLDHGFRRTKPSRSSKFKSLATRLGVALFALSYGFMASKLLQLWAGKDSAVCITGSESKHQMPQCMRLVLI